MPLMPVPGAADDVLELGEFRIPSQLAIRLFGKSYQLWRIALPPGSFKSRNPPGRDLLARFDHLAHGVTVAIAEVVKAVIAGREAQNMRVRQINDVDVIPNARAVRRRVIRPINLAMPGLAQRHLQHIGYQVGLGTVMLTELLARARGIKVAKGDEFQAVNLPVPEQDF